MSTIEIDSDTLGYHTGTAPAGDAILPTRRRGARSRNHNASKSDIHPAKQALIRYGKKAVNLRTRGGREYKAIYVTFLSYRTHIPVADLRTAKQIRTAEKTLPKDSLLEVEALASNGWLVHFLNAEVVRLPSIVRRDKTLVPLIAERDARLASYEKRREEFQQRYKKPAPTLAEIFRQRSVERTADTSTTQQPSAQAQSSQAVTSQGNPGNAAPLTIVKSAMPVPSVPETSQHSDFDSEQVADGANDPQAEEPEEDRPDWQCTRCGALFRGQIVRCKECGAQVMKL